MSAVKSKIAMVLLDFNQEYIVKNMLKGLAKDAKIKFSKLPGEPTQSTIFIAARGQPGGCA